MKKHNINVGIIWLGVICCFTIVFYGISLFQNIKLSEQIEKLEGAIDNTYGCQYIDSELDKLREAVDLSEYNYPIGDLGNDTYWYEYGVRQAWTTTTKDTICISADKHINVLYAYNMSIPANNNDPSQDRYYEFLDSTQPGYLIVGSVDSGFAIIAVSQRAE